jgi:hypothetical protein
VTECAPPADVEARGPGTPVADRPTIAVLPFPVLSDDLRVRFLVDGLAEDVIALLARVPGFLLISHASSFAFRGQQASLPDVARQLGVRYVVEGSVRAAGTLIRVSSRRRACAALGQGGLGVARQSWSRTPDRAWERRGVGDGVKSCPRAGCGLR